jgi:hypothetical protein
MNTKPVTTEFEREREIMQIADINAVHDVKDIAELELLLASRIEGCVNSFWLRQDNREFPKLSILVKDDFAAIYYLPQECEAGYCSKGEVASLGLEPGSCTAFSISRNSGDDVEVANEVLLPFCDALSAAKEFFYSGSLPECINWLEL